MENTLKVSLSPHEKSHFSVGMVMWGVVIAMIPALVMSVVIFGPRSLMVTLVAVASCLFFEWASNKVMKLPQTTKDGSAVITGILLAFNMPSSMPYGQVILGSLFGIVVGKMVFGGLGKNPFNPALVGRAFLLASFPTQITSWPVIGWRTTIQADGVTGATALGALKEGASDLPSYMDLFLGFTGGSLGEVSALALTIGGIFMLSTKIIRWHMPVFFLVGLGSFTGIFWLIDPVTYADPLYHILAGGAVLTAWFMITDMVTSPMSKKGKILYALLAGLITGAIRIWGAYPEGSSYAVLIMNAFVPLIDKGMKPKPYGIKKGAA